MDLWKKNSQEIRQEAIQAYLYFISTQLCPRGTKAEGRRASPGRPPARRFVCHKRDAPISRGLGQHKPPCTTVGNAAPRPGDARLQPLTPAPLPIHRTHLSPRAGKGLRRPFQRGFETSSPRQRTGRAPDPGSVLKSPFRLHRGCTGGVQGVYAWHPPLFGHSALCQTRIPR
jgi:hypothetical protein